MDKLISLIKAFDPRFMEVEDIVKARISNLYGGVYLTVLATTSRDEVFHFRWTRIKEKDIFVRASQGTDNRSDFEYSRYKIAVLCGKGLKDFHMTNSAGSCHEIALTTNNWIYTWIDTAGPLMNGANPMIWVPKEAMELKTFVVTQNLNPATITQVSAGERHALALDAEGNVWASGYHSRSPPDDGFFHVSDNIHNFNKIKGLNKKIVGIECGPRNSFALTEDGEVYAWGSRKLGILGDGESSEKWQRRPEILEIKDCKISKVSCGEIFVLALTDDGGVYSWGLDLQRESNVPDETFTKPKKLKGISAPVVDIYAGRLNAFCTTKSSVYAWGEAYYPLPTILPFSTIQEALMSAWDRVDFATTLTKVSGDNVAFSPFDGLFNDERDVDVEFDLEGGSLKAHSTILSFRSSVFRAKFGSKWETGRTMNYTVKLDHTQRAFEAFLEFVYRGKWDVDARILQEVLKISDIYGDEKLKEEFADHVLGQIRMENVFTLYVHYHPRKFKGNKQENIFLYIWKHWDELKETPEHASLDEKPRKELNRRIKWRLSAAEKKRAQESKEEEEFDSENLRMAILRQMHRVLGS